MTERRHEKWVKVPRDGQGIPKGHPYRYEFERDDGIPRAEEGISDGELFSGPRLKGDLFRDSTYVHLPTEPTWGLASTRLIPEWQFGKWKVNDDGTRLINTMTGKLGPWTHSDIKFIELTPEQIEQVEMRKLRPRNMAMMARG